MSRQSSRISAIFDKAAQVDAKVLTDWTEYGSCCVTVEVDNASLFLILGPRGGVRHLNCLMPYGVSHILSKSTPNKIWWAFEFFRTIQRYRERKAAA